MRYYADQRRWTTLLSLDQPPAWHPWVRVYAVVNRFWARLREPRVQTALPSLTASLAQEFILEHGQILAQPSWDSVPEVAWGLRARGRHTDRDSDVELPRSNACFKLWGSRSGVWLPKLPRGPARRIEVARRASPPRPAPEHVPPRVACSRSTGWRTARVDTARRGKLARQPILTDPTALGGRREIHPRHDSAAHHTHLSWGIAPGRGARCGSRTGSSRYRERAES